MADLTIYFPSSGAAPHNCAYDATWQGTGGAAHLGATTTKGTSAIGVRYPYHNSSQQYGLAAQWVSPALAARSWTTSDTFDIAVIVRESNAITDHLYLIVRVFNAAGDTEVGVLYEGAVNTVAWPSSYTSRHADGIAVQNAVSCPENGHIVVEWGMYTTTTAATDARVTVGEGSSGATAISLNDSDTNTDHYPFIAFTYGAAGTTHSAAGTAGGTSGASSSGRVLRPAKASAGAVSTAVAVACVLKAVIGVAGGTSDVAAKAYQEFSAKGAVASTSGATARGTIGYSVAGEARGTSAVTGAASVLKSVAGTAGGTSGATGAASVLRPAAGTAGGTSGATSSASVLKPVAGVIAATSSAAAAGTVTGEGGETHSAAGEVAGVSAVTGAAGVLHGDAVDFTLNVQSAITYAAATADGTSGADGVASVLKPVAGAAGGASTAEARGTADYSAVGAIAAVSSVTGTANTNETHSAAAEVAATSSATADATLGVGTTTAFNIKIQGAVVSVAGSIAATSTATATATEYGTGYMWAKINGTWVGIGSLTAGGGFPPTDGDVDGGTW